MERNGNTRKQLKPERGIRAPFLWEALFPVVLLACLMAFSVFLFGDASSEGANQIALLFASMAAVLIGRRNGHKWSEIREAVVAGVSTAIGPMLILLAVGSLIGTWAMSGTLISMVYYGLDILNAEYFYVAACVLCSIVGMCIGSSWTVAGTLGAGLMGIGASLNASPAITAAAVISGAYIGDQMSPLSDTCNLAAAVVETDLFRHIHHMLWVTVPAFLVSIGIFYLLGRQPAQESGVIKVEEIQLAIEHFYTITPLTLVPLLLVLFLAVRKIPASISIFSGALLGGVIAVIFQRSTVLQFAGAADDSLPNAIVLIKGVWIALFEGYTANTGISSLDALLSRGGMNSMLETIWLILSALTFGSILEHCGMLNRILSPLLRRARTTGRLIATTAATCIGCNAVMADQYISVALPGRLYRSTFRDRRLAMRNLSMVMGATGTLTSPLVPWNTCGAYMAVTLGVATLDYFPFCFFSFLCAGLAIIYGILEFKIVYIEVPEHQPEAPASMEAESISPNDVMTPFGRDR